MLKPYENPHILEAGLDEVSRGAWAGPVVAAAVILPHGFDGTGIRDSKKLTAKEREAAAERIRREALAWCIGEATPQEIDRINILQATYRAMHRAVLGLGIEAESLLVDGNRFAGLPFIPHSTHIKGDDLYLSIAAASILAKVHRDALMALLAEAHPGYGWARNVGYGTKVHQEGLRQHGPTAWHRMTFKPLMKF